MKWFGKAYGARYEGDCPHADTPTGSDCAWCDEPIEAEDDGLLIPFVTSSTAAEQPYHYECWQRTLVGGLNHQMRECICCGGSKNPDPDELTKRDAARAAVDLYHAMNAGRMKR